MLTGQTRLRNTELGLSDERERALANFDMAAQIRRLPAGPTIAITNNPIGSWHFRPGSAISNAQLEHLSFQIAIFANEGLQPGSFAPIFREAQQQWSRFPIGEGMEPLFHKRIPYAGAIEGLCLVGAFKDVDLRSGGELAVPMTGEAELVGNLMAWFIVDRSDGSVIQRELAPAESEQGD